MAVSIKRLCSRVRARSSIQLGAPATVLAGALLLRLISGVGFANYDTLYGLVWGQQLSRLQTPQYGIPIAPTPHPLLEALGLVLAPLGARFTVAVTVALGFLALSGSGWVLYRLGSHWFGRAAGALAALILLTRVPILSYGVRAYVDVPYLLFVLAALLVESRRRRAGTPVLVLLGLAGLLRPEAWAFAGVYWLYLYISASHSDPARTRSQLVSLGLLAAAAPAIWLAGDWLATGHPFWSLTNTRHTAQTLDRIVGIANAPEYIPRRIGEILRPPVLVGAALGGILALKRLRERARPGALAGGLAVLVFAAFAAAGLPINTRYGFLASAILSVFCGAGVFGWLLLSPGERLRRPWMVAGMLVLLALLASLPAQLRSAHRELENLARQQQIQDDLLALVDDGAITLRCGPVGVPNHAPIPLIALYLRASPSRIVSAQVQEISRGTYIDPASKEVEEDYILDPHDPRPRTATVPPGFTGTHTNRSWFVFERCV